MPIPPSTKIKIPLLRLYLDGKIYERGDFFDIICNYFNLEESQKLETTNSGRSKMDGQYGWAIYILVKEGLLKKCYKRHHQITTQGYDLLKTTKNELGDIDEMIDTYIQKSNISDAFDINLQIKENESPERRKVIIEKIVRNPKLAKYVKERAGYICQICYAKPFLKSNGEFYAEADHIEPLGGITAGGDILSNLRCLCAQCHAIITYGSKEEVSKILSIQKPVSNG